MKTDDLIAALSAHVEPVNRRFFVRTIGVGLAVGMTLTFGVILVGLGIRVDLTTGRALGFVLMKVAFALGVVALASGYLMRLARPGGEHGKSLGWVIIPFAGVVLLGAISLALAPSAHWDKLVMGDQWLECLISIPIIAILPFAAVITAVRTAAPTNLVRTGAFAGLVSGGISAMAYALHCTDDSLPFVAIWYGGTIVLCTMAGAILGPRLLRW